MTVLHTARLTLRPCTPADRAELWALEQDPQVMRYLNGGQPTAEEPDPAADFLMPRGDDPHVWTARLTHNAGFVGWFCLWPDEDGTAELGYRLARAAWGQGLATEGARALAHWGFAQAGYTRITACTMAVNHASRRVMERLGMTHIRTDYPSFVDPIPGADQGEVWYQLNRPQ